MKGRDMKGRKPVPKVKIAAASRIVFNPLNQVVFDPCCPLKNNSTRTGKYAHLCYDCDELLIDETDPEFACCTCGMPNPKT